MKKLFLLTDGLWEDCSIVGLFESEFEINYTFLKEKKEEYSRLLGVGCDDRDEILDDYGLMRHHMVMVMGRDWKYGDPTEPLTWEEYLQEYKDKVGDLEINFIQWLSDTGIMKPVDHEEVNL